MFEFNPDGSLKVPDVYSKRQKQNETKLKSQKCIKIRKEVVSFTAPKKCILRITLSDTISDNRFISNIYGYFKQHAKVPTELKKIDEKSYEVHIGTDFKRCSDCSSLIGRYREFLQGNIIEDKGSCTFEGRKKNFCYEDYFS